MNSHVAASNELQMEAPNPPRAHFVGWVSATPADDLPVIQVSPLPPVDDPSWTFEPEPQTEPAETWLSIERLEAQVMNEGIFDDRPVFSISLPELIARTLQSSIKQKQLEIRPAETRQLISAEYGAFDPAAFVASQFDVQNLQQSLEDNRVAFGMRKKHQYGGTLEFNETLGVQNNIAPFVLPDQGLASLNVIYTQELLRDGGKDIALGRGLIASYQYDRSLSRSVAESNELIQKTINVYWDLYRARAAYFIQKSLLAVAERLVVQIEERSQLVERSQNSLEQARALLYESQADLVDAQTRVLQVQDALFRLVNDAELNPSIVELVTSEIPSNHAGQLEPMQELGLAFQTRPEVREKLAAIRENATELQLSLNQLLPRLSVALRSSLNGFEDNRDFVGALSSLSDRPISGAAIANFEMYLNNRTARAKNKEAQLRARRLVLEYEDQLQAIREEVLTALRVIHNATPEIEFRSETLLARQREIDVLVERILINPDEGVSMILQLDQLFQSLHRLVRTQQQLIDAKVELQTSLAALQRAKGTLVSADAIPTDTTVGVPRPMQAFGDQIEDKGEFRQAIRDRVILEPLPR
ncbi:MAG: TolC family protein [Pirellula sp.]|nr:TolC family protein [Pirellula sp.]